MVSKVANDGQLDAVKPVGSGHVATAPICVGDRPYAGGLPWGAAVLLFTRLVLSSTHWVRLPCLAFYDRTSALGINDPHPRCSLYKKSIYDSGSGFRTCVGSETLPSSLWAFFQLQQRVWLDAAAHRTWSGINAPEAQ